MARVRSILIPILIVLLVIPILLVAITLGIRLWRWYSGPLEQDGAVWVSQDGKITIVTANRGGHGEGEMQLGNEILEFTINGTSYDYSLLIRYPGIDKINGISVISEMWNWSRKSRSEYVMTVTYSDTGYFTVGETITFYRADSLPTSAFD